MLHHDLRDPSTVVAKFGSHKQEVCGLRWSPDGTRLASGGNDNKLLVRREKDKSAREREENEKRVMQMRINLPVTFFWDFFLDLESFATAAA